MKNNLLVELSQIFSKNSFNLYLVGGAVRDFLLCRECGDFDFVTDAVVSDVRLMFPDGDYSFEKYGVSKVLFCGEKVDIVTLREETYDLVARKPSSISFTKSLLVDSYRRDFTINAMYIDSNGKIYDFHNGQEDLKNHLIRVIGDVCNRFNEDPLRMLRCLRFKMLLDFDIEEEADFFIRNNLCLLRDVSLSIVNLEIKKMKSISIDKFNFIVNEYGLDRYVVLDFPKRRLNVIDLHCDTITRCCDENKHLIKNDFHIDLNKLYKGQYLMQCFAIFLNLKKGKPYESFLNYYRCYLNELEVNRHYLQRVLNYDDLVKAKSLNKIGSLLSVEEGEVLEGDLSKLDDLYDKGVRMMTLTWNYPNSIGCGNVNVGVGLYDNKISHKGLTSFGKLVVKRMNELGMIIDVSHLDDKGFYDVISLSSSPIVASHSNCRKVHNVVRNLTDEMILLLHKNQGVMGINYFIDFLSCEVNGVNDIVKHIIHIKELGCIDNVCLGSDFDGISHSCLENASKLEALEKALLDNNFTRVEIEKIFFKNFIRVMKNVLK